MVDIIYGTRCEECRNYIVVNNGDASDIFGFNAAAAKCCVCGHVNILDENLPKEEAEEIFDDSELLLPKPEIFLIERDYDGYHGGGFLGFCFTKDEAESAKKRAEEEDTKSPCTHCGYVHTYSIHKVDKI